VEEQLEK